MAMPRPGQARLGPLPIPLNLLSPSAGASLLRRRRGAQLSSFIMQRMALSRMTPTLLEKGYLAVVASAVASASACLTRLGETKGTLATLEGNRRAQRRGHTQCFKQQKKQVCKFAS